MEGKGRCKRKKGMRRRRKGRVGGFVTGMIECLCKNSEHLSYLCPAYSNESAK